MSLQWLSKYFLLTDIKIWHVLFDCLEWIGNCCTVVEFAHSCKTPWAYQSQWSSGQKESNQSQVSSKQGIQVFSFLTTLRLPVSSSSIRLTDPIPTTETSIAPRQRPKAGQAQPQPISGILPIQPALTPRKRPNVAAGAPQPIGISSSVTSLYQS